MIAGLHPGAAFGQSGERSRANVQPDSEAQAAREGSHQESAQAAPAECGKTDYVLVSLELSKESAIDEADVLAQLRAGLSVSGISVCSPSNAPDEGEPLASVTVSVDELAGFELVLLVEDSVTVKRVSREVDLSKIPADSRALAIAIHVEELLRASWAEVMLNRKAPGTKTPTSPPEAVTRTVERAEKPARTPFRLSLDASAAAYLADFYVLGPSIRLGYAPVSWLELHGRFAPRWALDQETRSGTVSTQNVQIGLGARALTADPEQFRVLGEFELRAQYVNFAAQPTSGFVGGSRSSWGADASLGAGVSVPLSKRFSFEAVARGLVVFAGVAGADFGETVTGLVTGGGEVTLGVGARL